MNQNTLLIIAAVAAAIWIFKPKALPGGLTEQEYNTWLDKRFGTTK